VAGSRLFASDRILTTAMVRAKQAIQFLRELRCPLAFARRK